MELLHLLRVFSDCCGLDQSNLLDVQSALPIESHAGQYTLKERVAPGTQPDVRAAVHLEALSSSHDDGKAPGIVLSNRSASDETYFFYDNYWNGNGTAGADFDHPLKSQYVPAGHTMFVSLPSSFKGRVQMAS